MDTKQCRACKNKKPVSEFYKRLGSYACECKDCKREIDRQYRLKNADRIKQQKKAYYQENSERIRAKSKNWYENNKDRAAETVQAYRDSRPGWRKQYRSEWYQLNRDRILAQAKVYRTLNRDAVIQSTKDWFCRYPWKRSEYSHARRAKLRQAGGRFTKEQIDQLRKLQRGLCACCREKLSKRGEHIDHIQPISRGGDNNITNIQLLCPPCNCSKHARDPVEFMQKNGYLI